MSSPTFQNHFIHEVEKGIGIVAVAKRKGHHLVLEYYCKMQVSDFF